MTWPIYCSTNGALVYTMPPARHPTYSPAVSSQGRPWRFSCGLRVIRIVAAFIK